VWKLLALLVISTLAFSSVPGLVVSALLLVPAAYCARVPPRRLFRGGRPLFFLAFFLVLYKSVSFAGFNFAGFLDGLRQGLCIPVSFAAASLVFSVTSMSAVRASLGKGRAGLGAGLMLGFIPRFFAVWEDADLAWRARGGKNGPARILFLVPLAVEKMMEKASETAEALEARGISL
jgi:biotin transport system permease protein